MIENFLPMSHCSVLERNNKVREYQAMGSILFCKYPVIDQLRYHFIILQAIKAPVIGYHCTQSTSQMKIVRLID